MPKLSRLKYSTSSGDERELSFMASLAPGVQTTVLTGRNGSHKSSVLRDLVSSLILGDPKGALELSHNPATSANTGTVICASGSVADRFPPKENGGKATDYSDPRYVYLGQKVGSNLLSKKQPLATVLSFALNPALRDRFHEPFFRQAFNLCGIEPSIDLLIDGTKLQVKPSELYSQVSHIAIHDAIPDRSHRGRRMTMPMAKYLLKEFTQEDFYNLEQYFSASRRTARVRWSAYGFESKFGLQESALRLGLLSDSLNLRDATVRSNASGATFSAFELSSGEYHMLTHLLGLGFAVEPDSVVLIDEPENSLHPQWQQEFMASLTEIGTRLRYGHIVISTHSPLIVASAPSDALVVDLEQDYEGLQSNGDLYGASSDAILFDQFGVASSRNADVVDTVQRAVELFETNQQNTLEFTQAKAELVVVRAKLRLRDPLIEVIDALLGD